MLTQRINELINPFFFFCSTPGGNSISACELTCTLIGALARPIAPAVQSMKEGRWDRKLYSGSELYGKTLAVLGLGRIGREVGIRLKAWGMRVGLLDANTNTNWHDEGNYLRSLFINFCR